MFTRLTREIVLSAREGGADTDSNFRLRLAVERDGGVRKKWERPLRSWLEKWVARAKVPLDIDGSVEAMLDAVFGDGEPAEAMTSPMSPMGAGLGRQFDFRKAMMMRFSE